MSLETLFVIRNYGVLPAWLLLVIVPGWRWTDLFVGAWEVRDSHRLGIHHLAVVPCLVFTLTLGPLGLLAYLALRYGLSRNVLLGPSPAPAAG